MWTHTEQPWQLPFADHRNRNAAVICNRMDVVKKQQPKQGITFIFTRKPLSIGRMLLQRASPPPPQPRAYSCRHVTQLSNPATISGSRERYCRSRVSKPAALALPAEALLCGAAHSGNTGSQPEAEKRGRVSRGRGLGFRFRGAVGLTRGAAFRRCGRACPWHRCFRRAAACGGTFAHTS